MKKKVLMKRILTALAMAAMIPAGETWAATHDGDTLILGWGDSHTWENELPTYHCPSWPIDPVNVGEIGTVKITEKYMGSGNAGLEIKNLTGDMRNTNLEIEVPGGNNSKGQYALHVSAGKNTFDVNNFKAHIGASDSGAISIDNTATDSTVTIHGSLNATFDEGVSGNGIRANASFTQGAENKIIVVGDTDITLAGGQATYEGRVGMADWYKVSTQYNPAAVYAGNDSTTGKIEFTGVGVGHQVLILGDKALGKGQVVLNGDATIKIGSNNYGLYAGKNGQISVGGDLDLELTSAEADNAVGIAVENSTLIYKDKVDKVTGPAGVIEHGEELLISPDESENTYGSSVILNGDANVINVGTNNKAIYAEGVDANGISNTVKSGDSGIGSFTITGNVAAENGGNITLDARNAESVNRLKGDLTADGVGSVYVAEDEVKKAIYC